MRIVAIDPGTTHSAFLVWDAGVIEAETIPNMELRARLKGNNFGGAELIGIEMVASYGMAVGRETFETVRWIGRFEECAIPPVCLIYRKDVKLHLCGTVRAKDSNIRTAICDLFGGEKSAKGNKASKGPLYGVSGHLWSALAIALFVENQNGLTMPDTA